MAAVGGSSVLGSHGPEDDDDDVNACSRRSFAEWSTQQLVSVCQRKWAVTHYVTLAVSLETIIALPLSGGALWIQMERRAPSRASGKEEGKAETEGSL